MMSVSVCSILGSSSAKYPYIASDIVQVAPAVNATTTFHTSVPITLLSRDFSILQFPQYLSQTQLLHNWQETHFRSSPYAMRKSVLILIRGQAWVQDS
jgi:hypothetical protein